MADARSPLLKRHFQQTQAVSANYLIPGLGASAFSNQGATGAVTITLPNATVGQEYWFRVVAAQTFTVAAQAGNTIVGTPGGVG